VSVGIYCTWQVTLDTYWTKEKLNIGKSLRIQLRQVKIADKTSEHSYFEEKCRYHSFFE
jgi:hypothetical protein